LIVRLKVVAMFFGEKRIVLWEEPFSGQSGVAGLFPHPSLASFGAPSDLKIVSNARLHE
jgi:hypothetical protein